MPRRWVSKEEDLQVVLQLAPRREVKETRQRLPHFLTTRNRHFFVVLSARAAGAPLLRILGQGAQIQAAHIFAQLGIPGFGAVLRGSASIAWRGPKPSDRMTGFRLSF